MKKEEKNDQVDENIVQHKEPVFEFKPDVLRGHEWRQQGPFLVCKSCELEHSLYIGIDKQLKGFDEEGVPIIEKRSK